MAFSRYVDSKNEFVVTIVNGSVTDALVSEQVFQLNKIAIELPDLREFADLSKVANLNELAVHGTTRAARMEKHKPNSLLGIYCPDDPLLFGMVRAYQTFSEDKRKEVKIFNQKEEAIRWLSRDEKDFQALLNFYKGLIQ